MSDEALIRVEVALATLTGEVRTLNAETRGRMAVLETRVDTQEMGLQTVRGHAVWALRLVVGAFATAALTSLTFLP